jgi:8-oxo-dGTP pyrophosphatase MutT (NUDIX family)
VTVSSTLLTPDLFGPEALRARALARLHSDEPDRTVPAPLGDRLLNPDWPDPPHASLRTAAVLIPVVARRPEATILLTLRTQGLAAHSGQVAFPGGKIEESDDSALAAALREAEEEIGLDRALIELLGFLDPYASTSGFRIQPCVALIDPGFTLAPDPNEVAEVFEVPARFLLSPENHLQGNREVAGKLRHFYAMPYGRHHIWGVTANIIRSLYERLFG